jgi:hypothetical protein
MVIKEVYTIPTFSDISTYLQLFLLNPIIPCSNLTSIFFHYFKTRLHFKIDCIIFVKFKNVKNITPYKDSALGKKGCKNV